MRKKFFLYLRKTTKQKKIYARLTLNPQTSSSSHPSPLGQSLIGHKWIRNSCVVKRQPAPVQSYKSLRQRKWRDVKEEKEEERTCFDPSIFKTASPVEAGQSTPRVHAAQAVWLTQGLRGCLLQVIRNCQHQMAVMDWFARSRHIPASPSSF